jgi:hypothetical protein
MKEMGFLKHLIHLFESLYHDQQSAIKIAGEILDCFEVQKGVKQGCISSPYPGEFVGLVAKASPSKRRSTRFKSWRGKSFFESIGIFS